MLAPTIFWWIATLFITRGAIQAWRRADYAPAWGWLSALGVNVSLTVSPPRTAAWIADRTGIEGLPLLLACVCSTAAVICLFRMIEHLMGDQRHLPRVLASLPFGIAAIAAQLLAFAATPPQIGTSNPAAATAIPVPYRAIFGAYFAASCLALARVAWRGSRHSGDWATAGGFATQAAGWCCGCAFGLLQLLIGLDPRHFANLLAHAGLPASRGTLLLLTVGHFLPRVALRCGRTATYYQLWPLWALLHHALGYPPVYRGDMEHRWNWRPLLRPGDYARWLVLGIEDRASDLRPYIGVEEMGRVDAELARAGIVGAAAGPTRDAACLRLGLAGLAAGRPAMEAAWRLGVPHGLLAEARYLARVNAALRSPLVARITRQLADQQAPGDADQHHHEDEDRHQRDAGAELLAPHSAQRGQR